MAADPEALPIGAIVKELKNQTSRDALRCRSLRGKYRY